MWTVDARMERTAEKPEVAVLHGKLN